MFKNLTGFANLLKNAGQFSAKAEEIKNSLQAKSVEGNSGRSVRFVLNGVGEVQSVEIPEVLLDAEQKIVLQEEIVEAANLAVKAAKQLNAEAIRSATGDLDIPGLDGMINQLTQ